MHITNKNLKRRIIELSYTYTLSHIGSCLTAVDIIADIYKRKKLDEKFVLSCGHAGVALYVVLESEGLLPDQLTADDLVHTSGVHPTRQADLPLDCSTGSLGQGLPIALGMALAHREKQTYCLISDGEAAEGTTWESLNLIEKYKIKNIHVYINANEWGAYDPVESSNLSRKLGTFRIPNSVNFYRSDCSYLPFLKEQDAHYHVMTKEEYEQALEILS